MVTTVLALLIVLIAVCIAVWVLGRAVVNWMRFHRSRMREMMAPRSVRSVPPFGRSSAESGAPFPEPPDAILLRVESVPISQAGNPAPMLRTATITGTARWYHAALSYREVTAWYLTHLTAEGWQEEAGHGQLRVFRRNRTLLWLADGGDASIWQRLTNPRVSPRAPSTPDGGAATFTVLVYGTP